ncbi:hypothetical protein LBMAG21_02740 [Armatimonadota bacterium]|nr:hypothetical protein LBMAG21_02740 [Armatimonadota bacterium]
MNYRQILAVLVGMGAVALIFIYPPYYFVGQFFDGAEYFYYKNPPKIDYDVSYDDGLVAEELTIVALSVISAYIALGKTAPLRLRRRVFGLQFVQFCIFLVNAPSFGQFLAIETTWMLLFLISFPLFLYVLVAHVYDWAYRWRESKEGGG